MVFENESENVLDTSDISCRYLEFSPDSGVYFCIIKNGHTMILENCIDGNEKVLPFFQKETPKGLCKGPKPVICF